MKAAFGKVWRLEDIGGSIIGGVLKLIQEGRSNPAPPWDADLPKPKGQTVASFRKGLQTLPMAIERILGPERVKVDWELTDVKKEGGGYALTYTTPSGPTTVRAKAVVFTIPSYKLAQVLKVPVPAAAGKLGEFYYPPVGAVTVAYPKSSIKEERLALGGGELKGFGQLHPRSQKITTLGTIYSSVLFPNRAPEGMVLLLNYIGGAKNLSIEKMTDDQLVDQVDLDLRRMLIKDDAPKPRKVGVRVWKQAIPQFNVGHLDVLAAARKGLDGAQWDGVFLGGNYSAGESSGGGDGWGGGVGLGETGLAECEERVYCGVRLRVDRVRIRSARGFARGLAQLGGIDSAVFVSPNQLAGVALGRCVEGAYESAAEVATYLQKTAAAK